MNEKLKVCFECPYVELIGFLKIPRCPLCGCWLLLKTLTPGQHCPMGYW